MADGLRTFEGGVALVTGAGSGIGRELSDELAARGCRVDLADIDAADAEGVARQIGARGGSAAARELDVCSFLDVKVLVDETFARAGRLDYLFNNAGIGVAGEAADYTMDAWDRIVGVNLRGVIHGIQAAYPLMLRQGFGHIINTASMAGLTVAPGMISYTTTKHAVVALSRVLRAEAHARGVRVSVLCPGPIRTPLLEGGKHGIFVGAIPEARQRALALELFERLRPMPVARFAEKALDQIARNRGTIILPGWWRVAWWIERAFPGLTHVLARRGFERTRRRLGLAEERR
jgi:NAD(P)-dependent dehydrogenase (short-subunit alcohol dehydrogenase family)